jgi:dihydrofolate reductase
VVVSRDTNFMAEGAIVFYSINEAIEYAREKGETELFIIGGGEIYTQCLDMADKLYLTHVDAEIEGETLFPKFDLKEWDRNLILDQSANDVHKFSFKTYEYKRLD